MTSGFKRCVLIAAILMAFGILAAQEQVEQQSLYAQMFSGAGGYFMYAISSSASWCSFWPSSSSANLP
jgi:hypothetical protein